MQLSERQETEIRAGAVTPNADRASFGEDGRCRHRRAAATTSDSGARNHCWRREEPDDSCRPASIPEEKCLGSVRLHRPHYTLRTRVPRGTRTPTTGPVCRDACRCRDPLDSSDTPLGWRDDDIVFPQPCAAWTARGPGGDRPVPAVLPQAVGLSLAPTGRAGMGVDPGSWCFALE